MNPNVAMLKVYIGLGWVMTKAPRTAMLKVHMNCAAEGTEDCNAEWTMRRGLQG